MMTQEQATAYQRARNKRLHDAGLCVRCGQPLEAGDTRMYCAPCREKQKERNTARMKKLRAQGRCIKCTAKLPQGYGYAQCAECLKAQKGQHRNSRMTYMERGLCSDCGGERENKMFLLCEKCRRIRREAQQRYMYGGAHV